MRLLADENLPPVVVQALRARGHNVVSVQEERPGITDSEVLSWATSDGRLLLTLDKRDFGKLIFREKQEAPFGVLLFRIRNRHSLSEIAQIIVRVVEGAWDWEGHFSVARNENSVRMILLM